MIPTLQTSRSRGALLRERRIFAFQTIAAATVPQRGWCRLLTRQRVIGISLRNLGRQHKKQRLTLFEHTKKGGMK